MSRFSLRTPLALAGIGAVGLLTACGGGGGSSSSSTSGGNAYKVDQGQKKGGTLKVLSNSDVDNIDPGIAYYQLTYEFTSAADRPLYSYKPDDQTKPVPDLAASEPQISKDEKTITVKIRHGVKFSPPVNREVTAQDVKYAIERGFTKQVANGYVGLYFGSIQGAPKTPGNYKPIPGIQTPDKYTLVFKLDKPYAGTVSQALVLPITAPVPKEYAQKFDEQNPSSYGQHQVATGPYMLQMQGNKAVGYTAGKRILLVRNPNWDPKTDFRPAYVDRIDWTIGADSTVAGRQVLTGQDSVNGDTPPASIVRLGATRYKDQISFTGGQGNRYVALNTKIAPFNNANLRKAVYAAMDKTALQKTRGGSVVGDVATHFIPPGFPGFDEAGGMKGPQVDFNEHPSGSMEVAKKYLKAAGFKNGRYSGPRILMVGDNEAPADKTAQVVLQTLQSLGFNVNFRSVSHDAMYSNFCNVPAKKVQVCPNVGWIKDFNDGLALLKVPFYGPAITSTNNSNWPQLDDPKINAAMDKATTLTGDARTKAWADIDRMITETAAAVPWFWDKQPNIRSKNVKGVIAQWNAAWDFNYTSVK